MSTGTKDPNARGVLPDRWAPPLDAAPGPGIRGPSGTPLPPWYTARDRRVGNGFPRLVGLPVTGNEVAWPQVHVVRFDGGLVVEHWAVRDDAAMLDGVRA